MKRSIIYAALLIVISCLAAARSNAQHMFEFSHMSCEHNGVDCSSSIELAGGTIFGYSATEVDYWTQFDYSPEVEGWIYDQNGTMLDEQWDPEEGSIAQVFTSTLADPGMVYTEVGAHDVLARYHYEDIVRGPEGCAPCDGCNTDCYYFYDNWWWYDPFGFSFANTGFHGPWWDYYGFGPYHEIENDEVIQLGETSQSLQTPAPDHLVSFFDQAGYTNQTLTGTCATQYFMRQVGFQIVSSDSTGATAIGTVNIKENYDALTTNTCGNGNQPQPDSTCAPTAAGPGRFIESMSTSCGSHNGPTDCGYGIDWRWYWCGDSHHSVTELTALNARVTRDAVVFCRRLISWPNGTPFYPVTGPPCDAGCVDH